MDLGTPGSKYLPILTLVFESHAMNLLTIRVLAGDKPEPPSLSEGQRVAFLDLRACVTGVHQLCGHELVSLVGHSQMPESHRRLGVCLPSSISDYGERTVSRSAIYR